MVILYYIILYYIILYYIILYYIILYYIILYNAILFYQRETYTVKEKKKCYTDNLCNRSYLSG